ncbi:MAG: radical SAM family heme chaperone HemW [Alphaproteobacteria bacterium]
MENLALYIHWPFCLSKCPYCDFNSHVRESIDQDGWRGALLRELDHYAALLPERRVTSIFFGGGTPSLMEPKTVAALIERAGTHWNFAEDIEITLEANPTSVEAGNFAALAEAGVNRLSLGIQSLDDAALKFLGRQHDRGQALAAVDIAAKYFPRFSFDLIYARAGQSLDEWEQELRAALPYIRGHMSLYQLTIEENTAFHTRAARGEQLAAAPDIAAEMFTMTQAIMEDAGMPAYEISNHAAAGQESRHNLTYWRYDDFIGVGPGAHGRYKAADGLRYASVGRKSPEPWAAQVAAEGHGVQALTAVDDGAARQEALMMGLRLKSGIARDSWRKKFGGDVTEFLAAEKLRKLQHENMLRLDEDALAATTDGAIRLNAVLKYLLN